MIKNIQWITSDWAREYSNKSISFIVTSLSDSKDSPQNVSESSDKIT